MLQNCSRGDCCTWEVLEVHYLSPGKPLNLVFLGPGKVSVRAPENELLTSGGPLANIVTASC